MDSLSPEKEKQRNQCCVPCPKGRVRQLHLEALLLVQRRSHNFSHGGRLDQNQSKHTCTPTAGVRPVRYSNHPTSSEPALEAMAGNSSIQHCGHTQCRENCRIPVEVPQWLALHSACGAHNHLLLKDCKHPKLPRSQGGMGRELYHSGPEALTGPSPILGQRQPSSTWG